MMRIARVISVALALLVSSTYGEAAENTQNSTSSIDAYNKVAVLDMNYLLDQAKSSIALRNKIEEERVIIQEEIKVLEDELRAKEKHLIENQSSLDPIVAEARKTALEKEFEQVQEMVGEKKIQISKNLEDGMVRIQGAISDIMQKMAKERRFSLILPKNIVIYSIEPLDITKEVLDQLNQIMPGLQENQKGSNND